MVVALLVITAVSGGLLGLVYGMTKDTIAEVDQKKNAAAIAEVLGTDENSKLETVTIDDLTYNLAYDPQGNFLGAAVKTYSNSGFSGRIELMVGLLADGTINKVSVLSQSETPGLGANMVNPKFKDQFNGKNPASYNLSVTKDGGDVDAITAATISSRAFTGAVKLAYEGFEANKSQFIKGAATTVETPVAENSAETTEGGQDNE